MMEYTNKFTLDGRLKPHFSVTPTKVKAVAELFNKSKNGDRIAGAQLIETVTTSDAVFNLAHLINLQVLPQFDEAPRTWTAIAGVREVPDFKPVVLRGLFGEFEGLERQGTVTGVGSNNPEGIAPVVPEAAPYPYAVLGSDEADFGQVRKHGFKTGYTFEARINDRGTDFFGQIPGQMLQTMLDTEEWLVYDALITGTTAASQLSGGTTYTGATVLPNPVISRDALVRAIFVLKNREINGRKIGATSGFNLIVPLGTSDAVRFLLQQDLFEVQNGAFSLNASFLSDGVASTDIIESEYVTGTNWYLLPKPGTARRPVLELGKLQGYTSPELRIHNATGTYVGGGAVSPFEGSFDNDVIDMRIRHIVGGINWAPDSFIVWSKGTGTA
jgi:hypothetical protein